MTLFASLFQLKLNAYLSWISGFRRVALLLRRPPYWKQTCIVLSQTSPRPTQHHERDYVRTTTNGKWRGKVLTQIREISREKFSREHVAGPIRPLWSVEGSILLLLKLQKIVCCIIPGFSLVLSATLVTMRFPAQLQSKNGSSVFQLGSSSTSKHSVSLQEK